MICSKPGAGEMDHYLDHYVARLFPRHVEASDMNASKNDVVVIGDVVFKADD